MRRISFNLTQPQILDQTKTVTRRLGWLNLKVGERLLGVDRLRSKDAKKLAVVEVVSVRREPLNAITDEDVILEGNPFPRPEWQGQHGSVDFPAGRFIERFCSAMKCYPDTQVTRIEFRYLCSIPCDPDCVDRMLCPDAGCVGHSDCGFRPCGCATHFACEHRLAEVCA